MVITSGAFELGIIYPIYFEFTQMIGGLIELTREMFFSVLQVLC